MSSRNLAKSMPLVWGMLTLLFVLPALAAAQVRLLPAPREANFVGETALQAAIVVSVLGRDAEDECAGRDLEEAVKAVLAKLGLAFDAAMHDEGYLRQFL
jgi:hypothetical protein